MSYENSNYNSGLSSNNRETSYGRQSDSLGGTNTAYGDNTDRLDTGLSGGVLGGGNPTSNTYSGSNTGDNFGTGRSEYSSGGMGADGMTGAGGMMGTGSDGYSSTRDTGAGYTSNNFGGSEVRDNTQPSAGFGSSNADSSYGASNTGSGYGSSQRGDYGGDRDSSNTYGSNQRDDYDGDRDSSNTHNKPSMGDKLKGTMETMQGKMKKDPSLIAQGQERKAGNLDNNTGNIYDTNTSNTSSNY